MDQLRFRRQSRQTFPTSSRLNNPAQKLRCPTCQESFDPPEDDDTVRKEYDIEGPLTHGIEIDITEASWKLSKKDVFRKFLLKNNPQISVIIKKFSHGFEKFSKIETAFSMIRVNGPLKKLHEML